MMRYQRRLFLIGLAAPLLLGLLGLLGGCGRKTPLDTFPASAALTEPVMFVPINPPWNTAAHASLAAIGGFNRPVDIIAGYDEMIYVVDAGNNRIVQLNALGEVVSVSPPIQHIQSIGQRQDMRLIVAALQIPGTLNDTDAVLYELDLTASDGKIGNSVPRLFYTQPAFGLPNTLDETPPLRISAIGTLGNVPSLGNNAFYACLTPIDLTRRDTLAYQEEIPVTDSNGVVIGTSFVNRTQAISRVLVFNSANQSVGTIGNFDTSWALPASVLPPGFGSFQGVAGIATKAQPPQSDTVSSSADFFVVSVSPRQPLRFQHLIASLQGGGQLPYTYSPNSILARFFSTGDTFIGDQNRFKRASDLTYDPERTFLFIVDAETDSLYLYQTTGLQGVPVADAIGSVIPVSFSAFGNGDRLNAPEGVCYSRRTLYISDTGNNRILRFKLSLDIR